MMRGLAPAVTMRARRRALAVVPTVLMMRYMHTSRPLGAEVPWYVKEARDHLRPLAQSQESKMPALPEDSPKILKPIVARTVNELGLRDVSVIDARESSAVTGVMVVATGVSPKHLGSAAQELITMLKRDHDIVASRDGVLTSNFLRVHNRRQRRRAQHLRLGMPAAQHLSRTGAWVVLDTHNDVFVHLMTAERRASLDLDSLFDKEFADDESSDLPEEFVLPRRPASSHSQQDLTRSHKRGFHTGRISRSNRATPLELLNNLVAGSAADPDAFVASFGDSALTLEDWKMRLAYFSVAAAQAPAGVLLDRLVNEARLQQASGVTLDSDDIERVLSGICYNGQAEYAVKDASDEISMAAWHALCDVKAERILDLHSFACRASGKGMLTNPRAVVLLFRAFVSPAATSVSPEQALAHPTPQADVPLAMYWDRRLKPLRLLVEDCGELQQPPVFIMMLTALANGNSWSTFWRILDDMRLSSALDTSLIEVAVALVVRGGEPVQISHAIQAFVPSLMLQHSIKLTPALCRSLEAGLAVVDPQCTRFASLRQLLGTSPARPTTNPSDAISGPQFDLGQVKPKPV